MITDLFSKNIVKVLYLFLISPGSRYNRKEIKNKTEMNNLPLDSSLTKLIKTQILKKENNLFELNPSLPKNKAELINLLKLEKEKFISLPLKIYSILLDISEKLSEIKSIKNVFLFGSYAKLIYSEKSDIDLAIIFFEKAKNREKEEKKIKNIIKRIEERAKKKIEAHFFSEQDMEYKKDPLIKDISRNSRQVI